MKNAEQADVHINVSCQPKVQDTQAPFKSLLPQIAAAFISAAFHIVCGIALSYSAIIIPQLHAAQNVSNSTSEVIFVTEIDNSWIASSLPVLIALASVLAGPIMDDIGRLNIIKLAVVPSVIGWVLIATATNVTMIISGRVLNGISLAWGMSPCLVYISEISSPDMRGALVSFGPAIVSFGMLCGYLEGWMLEWRTVAWICLAFAIAPLVLLQSIPKSPPWLVSKGRYQEAKLALQWFNKYHPQYTEKVEMQLTALVNEHELKQKQDPVNRIEALLKQLKMFRCPAVYKPFLILSGLFLFQQSSGIFIILFYAVTFFDEVGTKLNPYLVSVYVGLVRFAMSIVAIWLMRRFGRRQLIMASGLGMAATLYISGLYTRWLHEGTSSEYWVPIAMLLLYITSSMVGFLGIPITIISELYPIAARGIAQSTSTALLYGIMFALARSYYSLKDLLGGASCLQYFFATMSLAGVFYSYVFLPETHNKSLTEIENYFNNHTIYLSYKKSKPTTT